MMRICLVLIGVMLASGCNKLVKENTASLSTINCSCETGPHTFGPNDERTIDQSCVVPDLACKNLCNAAGEGNGSLSYGGVCVE